MAFGKLIYGSEEYTIEDAKVEDVKKHIRDALLNGAAGSWVSVPLVADKTITILITPGVPVAVRESPGIAAAPQTYTF
ncbi:hypothetical protein [Nocardia fluminea]|uniref:hypothetical protein n=1 Tax=Nocardia fluminea TaxID=134984 RepID=UPI0036560301